VVGSRVRRVDKEWGSGHVGRLIISLQRIKAVFSCYICTINYAQVHCLF